MSASHSVLCSADRIGFSGHSHIELPPPDSAQLDALARLEVIDTVSRQELLDNLGRELPDSVRRHVSKNAKFYDKNSLLALHSSYRCLNELKALEAPGAAASLSTTGFVCGTYGGPVRWVLETNCHFPLERMDNPPINRLSAVVGYFGGVIGNVTIPLGMNGTAQVFTGLDAVGLSALVYAAASIKHNRDNAFVVGGVDSCVSHYVREQLRKALDVERVGVEMMQEGAGFLYLETAARASARHSALLAEIRSLAFDFRADELGLELERICTAEGLECSALDRIYLADFCQLSAKQCQGVGRDWLGQARLPLRAQDQVEELCGNYFGATLGIALSKAMAWGCAACGGESPVYVLVLLRDLQQRCGLVLLRFTRE